MAVSAVGAHAGSAKFFITSTISRIRVQGCHARLLVIDLPGPKFNMLQTARCEIAGPIFA